MKQILLIVVCAISLVSCGQNGTIKHLSSAPELKNQTDSLSWAYGQNIASVLQTGYFSKLNTELIVQSVLYTLEGHTDQPLSPEAIRQGIEYVMNMYAVSERNQAQNTQQNVDAQQSAYFERLEKDNPNVKRHPKGFYYEVLKQGKGENVRYAQRIEFDYRSYLMLTGQPYDQTYGKREPIIHVVGEPMFPGLIEAFQLMNPGSTYRFYFPYQLAFGAAGDGNIPGYTPMIYDIELHQAFKD